MENQIKIGSVVNLKMKDNKTYNFDFVVSGFDESKNAYYLRFYSPVTGKFEEFHGWVPADTLVLA